MPLPIPPGWPPSRGRGMAVFAVPFGAVVYAPRGTSAVHTRDGALVLPESRRTVASSAGSACVGLGLAASVGVPKAYTVLVVWGVAMAVSMARGGLGGPLLVDQDGVAYDAWRRRRRATWHDLARKRAVERIRREDVT